MGTGDVKGIRISGAAFPGLSEVEGRPADVRSFGGRASDVGL
jgi:hypothetical protein